MSKARVILAAFVAVLAISAVASASASAGSWYINSVKLPLNSKAALSTTAVVDQAAVLNVPTLSLKLTCAALKGVGPEIIGETTGKATHLDFESCSEIEPKTCKMTTGVVETESVTATVSTQTPPVDKVLFKPTSGTLFALIGFEGSCAFSGEQPVNGQVLVKAPTGQTENVSQLIEGLGAAEGNNSLELAKNKGFIEGGKALLKLASGSKWSFH